MFGNQNVSASEVLSARDMNVRPGRDVTEIVGTFLTVAEAVVAHWVEYSKGLLLFVMVPGDERSGEFYIYDRRKGSFWLLNLADSVFGGYAIVDMRQKIKDFRLLDFAEDPSLLRAAKGKQQLALRLRETGVKNTYAGSLAGNARDGDRVRAVVREPTCVYAAVGSAAF